MPTLNVSAELSRGLLALDDFLAGQGLSLEVLLIGANGMRCQNLISRGTRDLDNHNAMSEEVVEAIERIASEQGLPPDWLNDQAASIALPDGAVSRSVAVEAQFEKISFTTLARRDFLQMKVAAAVIRMEDTTRDLDDLREANISADEFERALAYVKQFHRPDGAEFLAYQDLDISQLRSALFGP